MFDGLSDDPTAGGEFPLPDDAVAGAEWVDSTRWDADGCPIMPAWLVEFDADPEVVAAKTADQDAFATQRAMELAMADPVERFEREYGIPGIVTPTDVDATTSEGAAAALQDIAVQLERVRRVADAHRVSVLLEAWEMTMADIRLRYPRDIQGRGGLGAQAFFKTMGLQFQQHPFTVAREVDAGLLLRDRLPKTWAVFVSGQASWGRVQIVVKEVEGLDGEYWADYDEVAARQVVTSTRLREVLRKTRERLQDHTAAARAKTTHERRHTTLETGPDGAAAFTVYGNAPDWVGFDQALHRAAVAAHGVDGETRTLAQLRHDITRDLLIEGIKQRADANWVGLQVHTRVGVEVQLVLTVPALAWLGKTTEQAHLAGYGPIDLETAKRLAGQAKSFIRVLTDPVTGVRLAMDRTARTPPTDLARWVRIRDGRSRFPGSNVPAHLADIDHAREWQHDGRTDEVNLVTLDRANHNLKSTGLFREELDADGSVPWYDDWGHRYVDPSDAPHDPAPDHLIPPEHRRTTDPGEPCPF